MMPARVRLVKSGVFLAASDIAYGTRSTPYTLLYSADFETVLEPLVATILDFHLQISSLLVLSQSRL